MLQFQADAFKLLILSDHLSKPVIMNGTNNGTSVNCAPVTVMARGILLSCCPSVCPVLVNVISQERLEGISLHLAQTSTWARG